MCPSLPARRSPSPSCPTPRTRRCHSQRHSTFAANNRAAAATTASSFQIKRRVGQHPAALPPRRGRITQRQGRRAEAPCRQGTVQAAGGFSGGGNRPQASKPAKNGVSLYLTLGRAGKAFHQAATANQEQSSHEQRRGAGLCLLPGGSDKPPAGWPQALRCPKNELGELWVWVLPALQPALSEGNGSAWRRGRS